MEWTSLNIAGDGTHHVRDGEPIYSERFDEVLGFRAPGLAPVRRGVQAWHIDPLGRAAYGLRFLRTFGFYQGLAAVAAADGWHHILPSGEDAYARRHSWCGNYQGGRCTVRDRNGRYYHIDASGGAAYGGRWSYAGDYRDGVAVVQAADGRSTHIDEAGDFVHGRWFLDLDVFHKGFARARDEDGWMHVNRAGQPIYGRRFGAVEPFYNGQARVERSDGALEIIDESGGPLVDLRPALRSEFAALSGDLVGFWRTQAIYAAVDVGVFEALPADVCQIARQCGLDADRARRLLRALGELGLVELVGAAWCPTRRGAFLRRADPLTLADAALEYGREFSQLWMALPAALWAEGVWSPPDIFAEVAKTPSRVAGHHRMLASYAHHDYSALPAALNLRGDEVVVDAGGGLGVLAGMLLRQYPPLRVVVLERSEVAGLASVPPDLSERLTFRAADLFQPWGVQADVVVLARVLHDWDDDNARHVLRHARATLPTGGQLFVVEMLLAEEGAAGGLCDLHLLLATGGRERTEAEYASLLAETGFGFRRVLRLPALPSVIVGEAQ